ncbi:hypothetical protein BO70DRAFT_403857 [Aspergillus heteromorphus CBS 117.55]|uniref:N-acetyltransferase domain-containing protein n=1 Tax=Aspergillus heteromorphus CBS 117.55 TaxID=1448321 RepID=A0A317WCB1_9EURO|nr:uncharacterized protein BO70DRAFT_403857 [Aspergillus heteromorphus CBS 117.55]PWY83575.1 hypothetical protein BO70DRAFT_403857 [Aspergillus heteromorphus CBS 117.55]
MMRLSDPVQPTLCDAPSLARILSTSIDDKNEGKVTTPSEEETKKQLAFLTTMFERDLTHPYRRYWVIRDLESGDSVSFISWALPVTEEKEERVREERRKTLPPVDAPEGPPSYMNDLMPKIEEMRRGILGVPRWLNWYCGNLATDPKYQRHGAASKLIRTPFEEADREGVACYLDTDLHGPAIELYKRNGFKQVGEGVSIGMEPYGGQGIHTHVGLIREPKKNA